MNPEIQNTNLSSLLAHLWDLKEHSNIGIQDARDVFLGGKRPESDSSSVRVWVRVEKTYYPGLILEGPKYFYEVSFLMTDEIVTLAVSADGSKILSITDTRDFESRRYSSIPSDHYMWESFKYDKNSETLKIFHRFGKSSSTATMPEEAPIKRLQISGENSIYGLLCRISEASKTPLSGEMTPIIFRELLPLSMQEETLQSH